MNLPQIKNIAPQKILEGLAANAHFKKRAHLFMTVLSWPLAHILPAVYIFSAAAATAYALLTGLESYMAFRTALVVSFLSGALLRHFISDRTRPFKSAIDPMPGLADGLACLTIIAFITMGAVIFADGPGALPLSVWVFWLLSAYVSWIGLYLAQRHFMPFNTAYGLGRKDIVIICAGEPGQKLCELLKKSDPRINILGFFDDRRSRLEADKLQAPFLGGMDDVVAYCRTHKVDKIIIALPGAAQQRLAQLAAVLSILPTAIYINPDSTVLDLERPVFGDVGPLKMVQLSCSPVTGWRAAVKRAEDIVVALVALAVFSPVFIIVPILIKRESPGPVFFRQKRYGYNNQLFDCLKFRSMRLEACEQKDIKLTDRDDPRVTRIGKFIRRTSLDELPQFINVLRGDMSVVGPRPHPPGVRAGNKVYEEVVDQFSLRYRVRLGLTGWAQINGARGNTFTEDDLRRRFEYDMNYIQNWSLWFDFMIIMRTLVMGFTGKNAF